jgi:ketosteroid isomerase-like protein
MTPKQVIESVYDAFRRGDIPFILSQVAPGAAWRQAKTLPWGGDYKGPEGAGEFFTKLDSHMQTVAFEAQENVESGNEVFSFGTYTGRSRATGREGEARWMFRWRVENGRITSWESYIDTAALLAAMK